VIAAAFSVPVGSLDFWAARLKSKAVSFKEGTHFGSRVTTFADPDGMILELIEHQEKDAPKGVDTPILAASASSSMCSGLV
jgi:hypothetical protein